MWCPSCGGEYRAGIEHCPRCGVALTRTAPGLVSARRPRLLGQTASLAILGAAAMLLARTAATFVLAPSPLVLAALAAVQLLGHVALGLFFAAFLLEYAWPRSTWLRLANGAVLGALAIAAITTGGHLARLLGGSALSWSASRLLSNALMLLLPATGVAFFAMVRAEAHAEDRVLRAAAAAALAATATSLAAHAAVLAWWSTHTTDAGQQLASRPLLMLGLVVAAAVGASLIWFLVAVRHHATAGPEPD